MRGGLERAASDGNLAAVPIRRVNPLYIKEIEQIRRILSGSPSDPDRM